MFTGTGWSFISLTLGWLRAALPRLLEEGAARVTNSSGVGGAASGPDTSATLERLEIVLAINSCMTSPATDRLAKHHVTAPSRPWRGDDPERAPARDGVIAPADPREAASSPVA